MLYSSPLHQEDSNDFFGFAPGKIVGLRHACCVRCDEILKDSDGNIELLRCSKVNKESCTSRKLSDNNNEVVLNCCHFFVGV